MTSHTPKKQLRKKKFVSKAIQGRLMMRISLYGLVFMLFTGTVLLIQFCLNNMNQLLSDDAKTFEMIFNQFVTEQFLVMLTFSLFLIPLVCIDMMKLSHGIAGPLVRFEAVLQDMKEGKTVAPVRLREGDLIDEFNGVFNEFLLVHNERLALLRQSGLMKELDADCEQEELVLAEVKEQKEMLEAGTEDSKCLS